MQCTMHCNALWSLQSVTQGFLVGIHILVYVYISLCAYHSPPAMPFLMYFSETGPPLYLLVLREPPSAH
jgi:hypothetical protein